MRAINRLRHNDDFRLSTRTGVRAARSHVMVHLALIDSSEDRRAQREPRVGFVVSKKVGNAVVRARTKRRLRPILDARLADLPPYAAVVVRTQPGIDQLSHAELVGEVDGALRSALTKHHARRSA